MQRLPPPSHAPRLAPASGERCQRASRRSGPDSHRGAHHRGGARLRDLAGRPPSLPSLSGPRYAPPPQSARLPPVENSAGTTFFVPTLAARARPLFLPRNGRAVLSFVCVLCCV